MSRNWSREDLAAALARNPGLRVTTEPLERARTVEIKPLISTKPVDKQANGIHELMAAPSYQGRLQPEEELSYRVATELRRLTHAGKLRCVWFRIPNEHPEGGRYGMLAQVKRVALGAVPGVPDFGFIWGSGGAFIELKVEGAQASLLAPSGKAGLRKGRRTYLRGRQKLFVAWAQAHGVRHAVARSVGEVVTTLQQWGVLT
jgi:hypothetical protein